MKKKIIIISLLIVVIISISTIFIVKKVKSKNSNTNLDNFTTYISEDTKEFLNDNFSQIRIFKGTTSPDVYTNFNNDLFVNPKLTSSTYPSVSTGLPTMECFEIFYQYKTILSKSFKISLTVQFDKDTTLTKELFDSYYKNGNGSSFVEISYYKYNTSDKEYFNEFPNMENNLISMNYNYNESYVNSGLYNSSRIFKSNDTTMSTPIDRTSLFENYPLLNQTFKSNTDYTFEFIIQDDFPNSVILSEYNIRIKMPNTFKVKEMNLGYIV